jgi:hypothetical protein
LLNRFLDEAAARKSGFSRTKTTGYLISNPANSIMRRFIPALAGVSGLVILMIALFYPQIAAML